MIRVKRNLMSAYISTILVISQAILFPARAMDSQAAAAASQALGMGAMTMAMVDTMGSGQHCGCMGEGCPPSAPWTTCAMIGMNIAAMLLSLLAAAQSEESEQAQNGGETSGTSGSSGESGSTGDSGTSSGSIGDTGDSGNSGVIGDNANNSSSSPYVPPVVKLPKPVQDACKENPDGFLCKDDPIAAIDAVQNDFMTAMEAGKFDGPGENGLPEGQTVAGTLANFDKAKSQLSAMLSNSATFGKSGSGKTKGTAGMDGAGTAAVGGTALTALKAGNNGPTNFGGVAKPGKIFIENGLELIDESTGKSLTLWQRATNRHQGSNSERAFMLARMENLRQDALKYMNIKNALTGGPTISKTEASSGDPKGERSPASVPDAATNPVKH